MGHLNPSRRWWLRVATGAVAIACVISLASAAVVTRQVGVTLTATPDGPNNMYSLDLDNDGTTDFTFTTIIGIPEDPTFASFAQISNPVFGSTNAEQVDVATSDGFPTVSRLAAGATVGSGAAFSNSGDNGNLFFIDTFDPPSGNFQNASGFVGLRFNNASGVHFGYAYVTVNDLFAAQNPLALTIGQVGYETVAGQSITLPPVPEPATASALVAGAIGFAGRGSRRAAR